MSILAWIILGLLAGFIGSKIVNRTGEGVALDIVLGVVGALVGGFLFNEFGAAGVTGLNLYSLLVAVVGAIVVLFLYHLVVRGTARRSGTHEGVMASEALLWQQGRIGTEPPCSPPFSPSRSRAPRPRRSRSTRRRTRRIRRR